MASERAEAPHCESLILHAPGECKWCDLYPDLQAARKLWRIAFTGHPPTPDETACPADLKRGPESYNNWSGNRAAAPEDKPTPPGVSHTTDPKDPRLHRGIDRQVTNQHEVYLVLSVEERAKGYVRPVRRSYRHSGGASACRTVTTMSAPLAETYARDPSFYGATYCCGCQKHLPVGDFTWMAKGGTDTTDIVGS
jgi:hypothetical protein